MEHPEDIDWQHPEVLTKLVDTLLEETLDWRSRARPGSRNEKDRPDLLGALRYVGEHLDAFQMARYLEDNRRWGSDQELVYALRGAATWRESIIRDMRRKLATSSTSEDKYFVGLRFKWKTNGVVYTIKSFDPDLDEREHYLLERADSGSRIRIGRERLDELFDGGEAVVL